MFTRYVGRGRAFLCCVLLFACLLQLRSALSCPFCLTPPRTWAEILDDADIVVVAEYVDVRTFEQDIHAETRFRVRRVHKLPSGPLNSGAIVPGMVITVPFYSAGAPGELFMMTGRIDTWADAAPTTFVEASEATDPFRTVSQSISDSGAASDPATAFPLITVTHSNAPVFVIPAAISWEDPTAVSAAAVDYILSCPDNRIPQRLRLPWYVNYLEHPDSEIGIDAWAEFARSEYDDVKSIRRLLSRDILRGWIADPRMSPERLGLYGMMLGLCGDERDAGFLRDQIGLPDDTQIRFGVDGLMGGFLLLTGESGLNYIERTRLRPAGAATNDVVSVVHALRFVWSYEPERIPPPRLRRAMRLVLNQDGLEETAITDLARWHDWSIMPRLVHMYDQCPEDRIGLRRVILEYARYCAAADPTSADYDPEATLMASLLVVEAAGDAAGPSADRQSQFVPPQ